MAGIGFDLRRALRRDGYLGLLRAYGLAGLLSAGPWLLSLLGMTVTEALWRRAGLPEEVFRRFSVCVTYLVSGSLVLSGALQFLLARFCADRVYERRGALVLPNLLGAMALVTPLGAALAALLLRRVPVSAAERALLLLSFVALCDLWIVVVMLSALRCLGALLRGFGAAYGLLCACAVLLHDRGLPGLLLAFFLGHGLLLFLLLGLVARAHPGAPLPAFDFLDRRLAYFDLALAGLLYNAALWIDRALFWADPALSEPVLGALRAAPAYDAPASLAYLGMVPGMAVFLLRVETDFAELHGRFYGAISQGAPLRQIEALRNELVRAIRRAVLEIVKVQGICALLLILGGPALLRALGAPAEHEGAFCRAVLGVSIFILFIAVVHLFFYFDLRRGGLLLCALLVALNGGLTLVSHRLGPGYYGLGLGAAAALCSLLGLHLLGRRLDRLEYATYMLQ